MSPERARAWIRVIRDAILIASGIAIVSVTLILWIVRDEPPNYTLLGFAALLFGIGPLMRADEWLLRRNGNGRTGKNGGDNGST